MSHYFMNDDNLKSNPSRYMVSFLNHHFVFYTDNGVFSKEKLDYGTKFLLECFVKTKKYGKILDLGCGYGPVGVILGKMFPDTQIDMVDINERAISLVKTNISCNDVCNAQVFRSDIYQNVSGKYDFIITNPPIRAGKNIVRSFLEDGKNYLKENGELWFVMRKDHGVKTMIRELENFFHFEIIDKSKGFYVVKLIGKEKSVR